ncbi:MAG: helix-turn-helix domain-containing protein, partial [Candidatus Eremiobacteraeota bacterium]|nr:helix-turn-helix domain-containing protein [Candidatus Eremiobacteraeota bacterium]
MESRGFAASPAYFGLLLREHRLAAGLSQEALAERARMSADGISALERGHRRTPQRETLMLLADALALTDAQRREFESSAARSIATRPESPGRAIARSFGLTSFVGRAIELDEIAALLGAHRLVTLTGTGGIGKTQTALRAGALVEAAGRGVRFAGFASVGGSLVIPAIASAVGARETPKRPLLETLIAFLRNKSLLLILDNCEHVISDAAAVAGALLAGCPRISILATSREPLRVAGERSYPLPSLTLPPAEETPRLTAAQAVGFEAIALFNDRATAVNRRFALTDDNAPIVARLCRRLDGIPLAIELAAARANSLSLAALIERIDERFGILTAGQRVALPRQQTMHAAIAWSYDLLSEAERRLFERLSIFVGGCTIDTAEAVAPDNRLPEADVLRLLAALAEKSLVVAELERSPARYRLLECTRAFAAEKLALEGDGCALARRHALWAADLADRVGELGATLPVEQWAREFEPELENGRSAIDWAIAAGEISIAARIACGFTAIWRVNHGHAEPRRWLEAILPKLDATDTSGLGARAWRALSTVSLGIHRAEAAQRAFSLDRPNDDPKKEVASLHQIGVGLLEAGLVDEAESANDRTIRICQERGLTQSRRYAAALDVRARIAATRGEIDAARRHYAEALALMKSLGDEHEAILIRINMGELEYRAGRFARALEFADAALAAARRVHSRHREITALANRAAYRIALSDIEGARSSAREALVLSQWAPPLEISAAIQHLATVAALSGDCPGAARLCGY